MDKKTAKFRVGVDTGGTFTDLIVIGDDGRLLRRKTLSTPDDFSRGILRALHALTEPVFGPLRRVIPALGGLDISPLIVLLLLTFLRNWLAIGTFF